MSSTPNPSQIFPLSSGSQVNSSTSSGSTLVLIEENLTNSKVVQNIDTNTIEGLIVSLATEHKNCKEDAPIAAEIFKLLYTIIVYNKIRTQNIADISSIVDSNILLNSNSADLSKSLGIFLILYQQDSYQLQQQHILSKPAFCHAILFLYICMMDTDANELTPIINKYKELALKQLERKDLNEAFVFFVNPRGDITDCSLEAIKKTYSYIEKKITLFKNQIDEQDKQLTLEELQHDTTFYIELNKFLVYPMLKDDEVKSNLVQLSSSTIKLIEPITHVFCQKSRPLPFYMKDKLTGFFSFHLFTLIAKQKMSHQEKTIKLESISNLLNIEIKPSNQAKSPLNYYASLHLVLRHHRSLYCSPSTNTNSFSELLFLCSQLNLAVFTKNPIAIDKYLSDHLLACSTLISKKLASSSNSDLKFEHQKKTILASGLVFLYQQDKDAEKIKSFHNRICDSIIGLVESGNIELIPKLLNEYFSLFGKDLSTYPIRKQVIFYYALSVLFNLFEPLDENDIDFDFLFIKGNIETIKQTLQTHTYDTSVIFTLYSNLLTTHIARKISPSKEFMTHLSLLFNNEIIQLINTTRKEAPQIGAFKELVDSFLLFDFFSYEKSNIQVLSCIKKTKYIKLFFNNISPTAQSSLGEQLFILASQKLIAFNQKKLNLIANDYSNIKKLAISLIELLHSIGVVKKEKVTEFHNSKKILTLNIKLEEFSRKAEEELLREISGTKSKKKGGGESQTKKQTSDNSL